MHRSNAHACREYDALTRRGFLAAGGAAMLAAAAVPAWLPRVTLARDHRSGQRDVLISLYLRGGADALSLFPPHAEIDYYASRPTIAVPRPGSGQTGAAIDLDGFFGMTPTFSPLLPAYQDGRLLIVHACGSRDPTRSHFEGQRFMESGRPGDQTIKTGWLGRHLASIPPMDPAALLRGVGIGAGLPMTLRGGPATLPVVNLASYGLTGTPGTDAVRRQAIADMYAQAGPPLDSIAQTSLATINLLGSINFNAYTPAGGAVYPNDATGIALKSTAALIKAQVGVEAIAIDVMGWDTHTDQGTNTGFLASLMNTFAQAVSAFDRDMNTGSTPSFTMVVLSEFGRRVAQNGNSGTDHGHGGAMIVLGGCVNGGRVLADWPGLSFGQLFEDRDLEVTIDYRDILAEVVRTRLGNEDLSTIFPGYNPIERGVIAC